MPEFEAAKAELAAAVERLYTEFSGYAHPHEMDFCPHCVSEAEVALLYARPLREQTAADLEKYAFKAMTTWGDISDFKYFLPRIFELLTLMSETTLFIDPEIAVGKLDYGKWRTWPATEQAAVVGFLQAWFRWCLSREFDHSSASNITGCVESIAQVEEDLESYLAIWRAAFFKENNARLNTAAFLGSSQQSLVKGGFSWRENRARAAQLINWLLERDLEPLLEQTALEFLEISNDHELMGILSGGIETLETLKMLYPQGAL